MLACRISSLATAAIIPSPHRMPLVQAFQPHNPTHSRVHVSTGGPRCSGRYRRQTIRRRQLNPKRTKASVSATGSNGNSHLTPYLNLLPLKVTRPFSPESEPPPHPVPTSPRKIQSVAILQRLHVRTVHPTRTSTRHRSDDPTGSRFQEAGAAVRGGDESCSGP